ncbi:hypothetical protein FACS1894176_09340 [Bacteroidia bacterium]|nr:hypothetical protein FACS1894176_09340 [Bacteroidia bacterium]
MELEVQDTINNQTKLIGRVYNMDVDTTTPIKEQTFYDTRSTIPSGQRGISSYGTVDFESFTLEEILPEI